MRILQQLYGSIRKGLRLERYIVVTMYFESGISWFVFDSHNQVYVNGSISATEHDALNKRFDLAHPDWL